MREVFTKDGSVSYYSEGYDEGYHSVTGAIEEAFKKYAEPCKIKELAAKGEISILDVCFGLGYNSLAAIHTALKENPRCKISIVGLENDEDILHKISQIDVFDYLKKDYDLIKSLAKSKDYEFYNNQIKIKIMLGDARETIKKINHKFDAVFLDPFSPKKCPELWTEEFFVDIRKRMKPNAILATYSCARIVRDNLRNAGFAVQDGPVVGRRASATVGRNIQH